MKSTPRVFAALIAPALLAWSALTAAPLAAQQAVNGATAEIRDAQGQIVGSAEMVAGTAGEANLRVTLNGFTSAAPGEHGIHIHAVGVCEAPGFTTASGHFNPTAKKHGLNNPEGHHTGDMPNLVLSAGGSATYQTTVAGITLDSGAATSLFDADGSAVVVHAGPDDLMTDPAGNSGARIACGVLTPASVQVAGMPRTGSATGNDSSGLAWLALAASMMAGGLLATRRTKRA